MVLGNRFKIQNFQKIESRIRKFRDFQLFLITLSKEKNCINEFSKIKRYEFSIYFYDFLLFFFFVPSVSSRLVSREIKLERDSTLVSKFRKRGIKFDKGSKRRRKKKEKRKKKKDG